MFVIRVALGVSHKGGRGVCHTYATVCHECEL